MLFRLHKKETDEIIYDGFVILPDGRVDLSELGGTPESYILQRGILIQGQPVFVGDGLEFSLTQYQKTNHSFEVFRRKLYTYGMLSVPENFDTIVIEVLTDVRDADYSVFRFKLNGEFLQQTEIENPFLEAGYFVTRMEGLAFLTRYLRVTDFKVTHNCTTPEWKCDGYIKDRYGKFNK